MTLRFHFPDKTVTNEVKPGDLVQHVLDGNDPHSVVYVRAVDLGNGKNSSWMTSAAMGGSGSLVLSEDPTLKGDAKLSPSS